MNQLGDDPHTRTNRPNMNLPCRTYRGPVNQNRINSILNPSLETGSDDLWSADRGHDTVLCKGWASVLRMQWVLDCRAEDHEIGMRTVYPNAEGEPAIA